MTAPGHRHGDRTLTNQALPRRLEAGEPLQRRKAGRAATQDRSLRARQRYLCGQRYFLYTVLRELSGFLRRCLAGDGHPEDAGMPFLEDLEPDPH
jgi:hypothetical protein